MLPGQPNVDFNSAYLPEFLENGLQIGILIRVL